jgi:hypothetical protein
MNKSTVCSGARCQWAELNMGHTVQTTHVCRGRRNMRSGHSVAHHHRKDVRGAPGGVALLPSDPQLHSLRPTKLWADLILTRLCMRPPCLHRAHGEADAAKHYGHGCSTPAESSRTPCRSARPPSLLHSAMPADCPGCTCRAEQLTSVRPLDIVMGSRAHSGRSCAVLRQSFGQHPMPTMS